jgi:hypothetical protein
MAGNEAAFGFDAATRAPINAALARAQAEGRAAATPLFPLVQDPQPQPSFQVILPVYDAGGRVVGDTAVVVRAANWCSMALAGAGLLDDSQVVMSVYAGARATPANLVFTTSAARMPCPRANCWAAGSPRNTRAMPRAFSISPAVPGWSKSPRCRVRSRPTTWHRWQCWPAASCSA